MNRFDQAKALLDYDRAVQSKLAEICEPLKLLGVSNFSYAKITKDKKLFRIANHQGYTDLFYKLEIFNHPQNSRGLMTASAFQQEKQTSLYVWNESNYSLSGLRRQVGMWNGANIYHTMEDYIEAWSFGGTLEDTFLPDLIINNMKLLNKYCAFFKSAAGDLIDISDRCKTIDIKFHDVDSCTMNLNQERRDKFNQLISTNRYLISLGINKFYLTAREIEQLSYKNQGLSAKEIARKLNISYRSVESSFDRIKNKSGLGSIKQILAICKGEGLL